MLSFLEHRLLLFFLASFLQREKNTWSECRTWPHLAFFRKESFYNKPSALCFRWRQLWHRLVKLEWSVQLLRKLYSLQFSFCDRKTSSTGTKTQQQTHANEWSKDANYGMMGPEVVRVLSLILESRTWKKGGGLRKMANKDLKEPTGKGLWTKFHSSWCNKRLYAAEGRLKGDIQSF